MKRKDKDAFHSATRTELDKKAQELRKQITEANLTSQTKEVKNKRITKELRKKLAIVLSIRRAKTLAEESR